MQCPNCGEEIPSNLKFCIRCGAKIPEGPVCVACGQALAPGLKFCTKCGAKVAEEKVCHACGTPLEPGVRFCTKCGAAVPERQVCLFCGRPVKPGIKFCSACGKPVNAAPQPVKPAAGPKPAPKQAGPGKPAGKNKRILLIVAACCAAFVIILVAALASPAGEGGVTGKLNTGVATQVAQGAVGPEGGTVVVDSGQLEGMTISVPEGAYEDQIDFTVSEAPITSQTFGEDFKPVSPLISVNNGEVFAAEPLEVTVPIHLEEGQFAMGFYYDEEAGTLEGIPLAEETDSSITLLTKHFSDIYIAMAEEGHILGRAMDGIDSKFRPGTDDFITPNLGSYAAPGGYCVGQCITEQYYYMMKEYGGAWSGQLYGRFDNNGLGDTPAFEWDDANVVRLCTGMQKAYAYNWDAGTELQEYWDFKDTGSDEKTFYALAYAMMASGDPQMFDCRRKNANGGHMVLAYKIESDTIWVADPNFPADTSEQRTIKYDRAAAGGPTLTPYYSAQNAEEAKRTGVVPYDDFFYYGTYALVDRLTVHAAWQNFLDGKTPGIGMFPDDIKITAFTGLKETDTGEQEKDIVPLENGLTLKESRLQDTVAAGGKLFFKVEYPAAFMDAGIITYIGVKDQTTEKLPSMEGFYGIQLKPGENDIGIYYCAVNPNRTDKGYRYVNFYRFKVNYDDGTGAAQTAAATDSPQAEEGFEGSWQIYTSELLRVQGSETTMDYVNSLFSQYGGTRAMGTNSAYASLDAYIAAQNEGYVREPIEFEKRNLVITKNADGTYSAVINGYITYGDEKRPYTKTFDQVEVSGNTITFQIPYDAVEFTGREGYELTLSGDTLTGFKYLPFMHPYASNDDQLSATGGDDSSTIMGPNISIETTSNGTPDGYDPEEVWSFEAVRAG